MTTLPLDQTKLESISDESISHLAFALSIGLIAIVAWLLFDHFSKSADLYTALLFTMGGLALIIALALMDLALFILHFKRELKGGK